jgi:uncharacterized protein YndB with AHSA1/START domain
MKKLEFKIDIAAKPQKVWDKMFDPVTYKKWVAASWPGSYYEGEWGKDEDLKFISPGQGGTLAHLDEYTPNDHVLARHIGVINPDGSVDKESQIAKGWIGTTERYSFKEKNGKTTLTVEINTTPEWEKMFSDGWPNALKKLKEICEN